MYKHTKEHLKQAGELMIRTSDGKEFELHLHNVGFDDKNQIIEIDAGTATYWVNGGEIIYSWIHREGPEGE